MEYFAVKSRLFASLGVLLALVWIAIPAPAWTANKETLEVVTQSGVHAFNVEVVANDEERQKGLMFRKELPDGNGMLFDFKVEAPVSFWKNTLIPLDMIFIRGDGRIASIAENTTPMSERLVPSNGPVRGVLEVIAGTAHKLGIKPGDRVAHRIFSGK
jgi:uncharacterized membrane protein (UPF0127 family)